MLDDRSHFRIWKIIVRYSYIHHQRYLSRIFTIDLSISRESVCFYRVFLLDRSSSIYHFPTPISVPRFSLKNRLVSPTEIVLYGQMQSNPPYLQETVPFDFVSGKLSRPAIVPRVAAGSSNSPLFPGAKLRLIRV